MRGRVGGLQGMAVPDIAGDLSAEQVDLVMHFNHACRPDHDAGNQHRLVQPYEQCAEQGELQQQKCKFCEWFCGKFKARAFCHGPSPPQSPPYKKTSAALNR